MPRFIVSQPSPMIDIEIEAEDADDALRYGIEAFVMAAKMRDTYAVVRIEKQPA